MISAINDSTEHCIWYQQQTVLVKQVATLENSPVQALQKPHIIAHHHLRIELTHRVQHNSNRDQHLRRAQ